MVFPPAQDPENDNPEISLCPTIFLLRLDFIYYIHHFRKSLNNRSEYPFFIIGVNNKLRLIILHLVEKNIYFDIIMVTAVIYNCFVICLDNPSIYGTNLGEFVTVSNIALNVVFLIEALLKIFSHGFLIGMDAYLKSSRNIIDFFLVLSSTIYSLATLAEVEDSSLLITLRFCQILRALRPLRLVGRVKGMQIALHTLLISMKPILNIILMTLAVFLTFAILGLQIFKGSFWHCVDHAAGHGGDSEDDILQKAMREKILLTVKNKTDCLANEMSWVNKDFNFDNIGNALMALFVFSTFDGWVNIARDGVDSIGPDIQPQQNSRPLCIIYFVSFLLIVCFFVSQPFCN